MFLHRDDLKKMVEMAEKFPEVEFFEVESDNSSGIGATVTMKVQTKIGDIEGTFEMVISSVENW